MTSGSFYELSFDDLTRLLRENGIAERSAALLFNWHYKKNKREMFRHQDLSLAAREFVYRTFDFGVPVTRFVQAAPDRTVKFLFEMKDERRVEAVLIPFQGKYTLCLSSQVGCAMKCAFCFTGTQGLTRNLSTAEIVGQFLAAKNWLTENRPGDDRVLNIVFMGQGEPLHNFDSVKKACEIFLSQYGVSLAEHKITVSTSGYLPGLIRWKDEMPGVNIALSLHSPIDEKRSRLIPLNRKYPLAEIIPMVESIPKGDKRFVTYEYLIIKGLNDGVEDAEATVKLLKGTKAFVNLIPFNPFPGTEFSRPEDSAVEMFRGIVEKNGIPVTVRTTKGDEILAACGQLNTKVQS